MYNKFTKTVMESINMFIDDTILEKDVDEDGEGSSHKKNEGDDNMSQSDDDERESLEKEFTPPTSRRETKHKDLQVHSPLQKFNL